MLLDFIFNFFLFAECVWHKYYHLEMEQVSINILIHPSTVS